MPAASRSNLFAWAQLVRLPNVFTSISNVMMGYFFVHLGVSSWGKRLVLLVGSFILPLHVRHGFERFVRS